MPRRDEGKLGGLVRRKLVRECAMKEPGVTWGSIARRYDVSLNALKDFRDRHADQIAAVAADVDNEFAGMLIANKAARLAAYEEIFEKAGIPQPKVTPAGKVAYAYDDEEGTDKAIMEIDVRAQMQALKQAAEELGQLPNRVTLQGSLDTTTTYKIMDVSDDDLT